MRPFEGRVAVVTGAASGIGRAVALRLAARGCDLAICCDSNVQGLGETASGIEQLGRQVSTHQVDVSDRDAVYAFARDVLKEHGRVEILVNNAGVGMVSPIETMEYTDFEWLVNINFWGYVYCTKAFLPHLRKHESHIANVSSVWGIWAAPAQAAYSVSKFAVRGFTEALSQELAQTRTSVSVVIPGGVRTDIVRNSRYRSGAGNLSDPQAATKLFDRLAMTSPEDAARIIVCGMERRKRRILVGPDAYLIDGLQRLFPSAYQSIFPRVLEFLNRE